MNILSHLYLSGPSTAIMAGNFIADFVKGKQYLEYPKEVAKGIILHRKIDFYTDQHPVFLQSKKRLWPNYRHYSGVIADIFYDHFLASCWKNYHSLPLESFVQKAYQNLLTRKNIFPKTCLYMLDSMVKYNWLVNYAELDGIARALQGMARRTPFESNMQNAIQDLQTNYASYKEEFELFFPQISHYCQELLKNDNLEP
jgi:acyl carrier protein phosphodiesterase